MSRIVGMIAVGIPYKMAAALLVGTVLLAVGCVSAPTQGLSDARQAVQAAREAGAATQAPEQLRSAELHLSRAEQAFDKGLFRHAEQDARMSHQIALKAGKTAQTNNAINQAQRAVEQARKNHALSADVVSLLAGAEVAAATGEEEHAAVLAVKVGKVALLDIERKRAHERNLSYLRQAKPMRGKIRLYLSAMNSEQHRQWQSAGEALAKNEGQKALSLLKQLGSELAAIIRQRQVEKAAISRQRGYIQYRVQRGDTLWFIARRKGIYGNSLMWPLIYRDNIDSVTNADTIRPGDVLLIQSRPSAANIRSAIEFAKRRGPGALKEIRQADRGYLGSQVQL
ncbi:MAG: DUF4398 domain-containing protein [Gammaproteobacteria bacterium]|nr:DUF4398 domain-containing protein [Gammaproteobacteria bacterium]